MRITDQDSSTVRIDKPTQPESSEEIQHQLIPTNCNEFGGLLTIAQASTWATRHTGRNVTPSNISYLINYGRIASVSQSSNSMVRLTDLENYYRSRSVHHQSSYKQRLGEDLNWHLSFEEYKEAETTKHVHRLHPYKGKFIPQLVEYFIDSHTDEFKRNACFSPGDIILDPFCGSGTTLVQSNETGLHAIGIDVSSFNSMISNLKLAKVNLSELTSATFLVENCIAANLEGQRARAFEERLLAELKDFNSNHFPSPAFRNQVRSGEIDQATYTEEKTSAFLPTYNNLLKTCEVNNQIDGRSATFLENWYHESVRSEIESAIACIEGYSDSLVRDVLRMILSRTVRSSRATTHSDLATLIRPTVETYYCRKHSKICKPVFSLLTWWKRYAKDTIRRMAEFQGLRTDTYQVCLTGDSRELDPLTELEWVSPSFATLARHQKIRGIFSSPPYVGMIDYHDQHAYAYELYGLPRNDKSEIGPLSSGQGERARNMYVEDVARVLLNCQSYMASDYDVFLVANDKFGLYESIAERAGMKITQEYRRPVLNRAEGDKGAYSETIFHMRRRGGNVHENGD